MKGNYSLPVVLVICSDPRKVNLLKRLLKDKFYVLETADGAAALEWLSNVSIDLVILDQQLHGNGTLDLCRAMHKKSGMGSLPIILISNALKKTFIVEALNAGVTDFLAEPLEEKEVFQRIAVVERTQEIQKRTSQLAGRLKESALASPQAMPFRFVLGGELLKEFNKVKQTKKPFSLLMIEVERFEEIVKKWGASAGEAVLRKVRALLQEYQERADLLFPQKGGNFVLLLPDASSESAEEISKAIQKKAKATIIATEKKDLILELSVRLLPFNTSSAQGDKAFEAFGKLLAKTKKRKKS